MHIVDHCKQLVSHNRSFLFFVEGLMCRMPTTISFVSALCPQLWDQWSQQNDLAPNSGQPQSKTIDWTNALNFKWSATDSLAFAQRNVLRKRLQKSEIWLNFELHLVQGDQEDSQQPQTQQHLQALNWNHAWQTREHKNNECQKRAQQQLKKLNEKKKAEQSKTMCQLRNLAQLLCAFPLTPPKKSNFSPAIQHWGSLVEQSDVNASLLTSSVKVTSSD